MMDWPNIYLLGFMGSGKSTIGELLAKRIAFQWIDLDEVIVQRNGMTVSQIFSKYGESFFRKEEATVLRKTLLLQKSVISCGGGTPCFENNLEWINRHGLSIFIDPSVEILLKRLLLGQDKRPLLRRKSASELKQFIIDKLTERRPVYESALIHFHQEQEDLQTVEPIIALIKSYYDQK